MIEPKVTQLLAGQVHGGLRLLLQAGHKFQLIQGRHGCQMLAIPKLLPGIE